MRVIGLISGTSYDAVEAVAADLELDGPTLVADLRGHTSAPYPEHLRTAIAELLPPAETTIDEVCRIDTAVGRHFGEVAAELAEQAFGTRADLVCSPGQTVFHWVEDGRALGTLQLGQAAYIAEQTGSAVVADVRARDVAAGGHGAPLASLLDVLLLGEHPDRVRGSLNLGGIANVTIVGPDREPIAFDNGPANALLDAVITWGTKGGETFDRDGARAARGTVDEELLARFLDEPYYTAPPPKSTGKELFHLPYVLDKLGDGRPALDDLLATLTALSAEVVARDLRSFAVADVVAAGGGTRNRTLMAELARRLPGVPIEPIDAYGIPAAAKEGLMFALIGFLTMHGLPGAIPSCTGAAGPRVLGAIVPGDGPLPVARGAVMPSRLVVRTSLEAAA